MKTRVLSGIRPTGMLHLGNYFGAVKGMIQLQDDPDRETLYMVADLHAITTPYDPRVLRADTRSVVMSYLAAGLNPEKSTLFVQSDLAEYHAQLSFYFSSVTSVARMQHLPTYK
ncbi:tryptophan--tRNA ligase, partial [Candidatus Woesebacteria bacterium]|nr:tryptophan--tRNA ligase [Candidatus Woesebacteria bacterium]